MAGRIRREPHAAQRVLPARGTSLVAVALASLLDRSSGEALPLPRGLAERYGGQLRMPGATPHVFANFVATIDGVVSYGMPGFDQAKAVSAGHPGDRFILALLRAVADVVIVGAGTLRKEPKSVWTAASVFPDAAKDFAELRAAMGLRPEPLTVLVSASGDLDLSLPAFTGEAPVLVATTNDGMRLLRSRSPSLRTVALTESGPFPSEGLIALSTREGGPRVLTEGGPSLLGQLLRDRVVDELFLTVAPRLAGRDRDVHRLSLVEGAAFTPETAPQGELVSLREADGYLFTRYRLARG